MEVRYINRKGKTLTFSQYDKFVDPFGVFVEYGMLVYPSGWWSFAVCMDGDITKEVHSSKEASNIFEALKEN